MKSIIPQPKIFILNFNQKNTREQLLFGYRNLLYSFVLSFLFFNGFSQSNTNEFNLSPNGVLDNVFDHFGNHYYLENLMVDGNTNESISSKATLLNCSSTSIFNLYFEPGSGMEVVSNPTQNAINAARRAVVCQVFQDVSNFINTPLTNVGNTTKVNIWVRNINNVYTNPNGILGMASGFYNLPASQVNGGIVDNEIWKTIHTGADSYLGVTVPLTPLGGGTNQTGLFYHGMLTFNFNTEDNTGTLPNTNPIVWNTNLTNTTIPFANFDLYSVVLHEITHALGFNSLINTNGDSIFGPNFRFYSRYDTFLRANNSTNSILTTNACSDMYDNHFNNALNVSVLHPNPNNCTNNELTTCSNAIQFSGANIIVPVFTPNCFNPISSLSHFEDSHFPTCNTLNGNDNYFLMCNALSNGRIRRHLKPEERQALCDIGYSVKDFFGSNLVYDSYSDYDGGNCGGITVAGINDGINNDGTYSTFVTSGVNFLLSGAVFLSNDINQAGFSCLQDLTDPLAFTVSSGNSSTTVTFNSTVNGLHLLRYVPINGNQRGNITYIYIFVRPSDQVVTCNPTSTVCNLVSNGNFEQHVQVPTGLTQPLPGNNQFERACGWNRVNLGNTPEYHFRNATPLNTIGVPCNAFGNENDRLLGDGYAGIAMTIYPNYVISEMASTTLTTPILPNRTYQLQFDASLAEYYSHNSVRLQAFISTVSPQSGIITGNIIPNSILNTGILSTNQMFSNTTNGWQTITMNITTPTTLNTGTQFLYIGALNATPRQLENPFTGNVASCPNQFANDTTPYAYYYIDNVSLIETHGETFDLPETFCNNQPINLNDRISNVTPEGQFSGTGVSGNILNIATPGTYTITYTYNNNVNCPMTLTDTITINSCLPTCTLGLVSDTFDSNNQVVCVGNPINYITYATTGNPSNVTFSGLPIGVTGSYVGNLAIIHGTPTVAGVYNYTLTTVGCATNITATGTITIVAPPTVGAITGINSLCVGSTTTFINATAGGSWSSNNSTVAAVNAATGLVTGSSVGSATISYTVSGINGCSDAVITKAITITNCQPPCTISISPANSSNAITTCISKPITAITYAVTGNPSSVTITGLPTGLTSNYNNGVFTISGTPTVAGVFNYTITTVGCVTNITATGTINVVTPPSIAIINGPTNICITNNTTQLTNATPNGTWSSIYPSIATISANGIISPLSIGTAKFSYTITGQGNCSSSTVYKNIVINAPPLSSGTISTAQGLTITNNTISVCKNDAVTLLSTVPGGSWTSSNSAVASIAPTTGFVYTSNSTTGTTTLTYTVTTGTGIAACSLSTSIQLEVRPLPSVGVIIGATAICLNNTSITYTNSAPGGLWESTNPSVAIINSVGLITPVSIGSTTINYTVTGSNNCVAVATKTLTINAPPSTPILTIYDANNNIIPASQFNFICPGTTFTVTASLLGGTWSSNRPTYASVVVDSTNPTIATVTTIAPSTSTYLSYTIPASGGCPKVVVSIQVPIIDPLTIIKAYADSAVITNPPGGVIALSSPANTLNTVLFNDVYASTTPTTGTVSSAITLSQVINSTYPAIPGITLNITTGQISVANNVPASPVGQPYILRYRICATLPFCAEPVCAEANVSITVGWSPITSTVKGNLLSASGICYTTTGYTSTTSLYYGVKINGVDASPANAVIIPTFPTAPTGWSLNAGGYIVAPNNALPGNYSFPYKVKPIGSTAYINLTCTFTIGSTLVAYPDTVTFRIGYNGKPYICYAPTESVLENDSVVHCGGTTTVTTSVPAIAGVGGNVSINVQPVNNSMPFFIDPVTYEVKVNTSGYDFIQNPIDETATYYLTYQICDNAFVSPNICATGWVTLSKGTTCNGYALEPQDDFVNLYTNIYNSDQYCMYYVNGYDNVLDNDAIHHYEDNSLEPAVIGMGGNVILNVLDANPPTPSDPFYIDADGAILANPNYTGASALNEVHTLNYALADVNFPQNLQMRTVYFYPYSEYCWGSQNKNSKIIKNSILNNVEINPNPSDGIFTILFKEMVKQDTSLEVFDSRGRKLIKKAVSDVKEYPLNLEGFASGTYILKIVDDTQTVYKKIILK